MGTHDGSFEVGDDFRPTSPKLDIGDVSQADDAFLDNKPPEKRLSWIEKKNLVFLFALCFVHAIPMSFTWATMPVLLRQQVSYLVVGTFYISQYPYSVKVLWSPIVEACQIRALGRRKSWVMPGFIAASGVIFWLAFNQDDLISRIAQGESGAMILLVSSWFLLTLICSVLRIGIDAWGLELLTQANVHWTGTIITAGEIVATFISFNLFLGLSTSSTTQVEDSEHVDEISTRFYFLFTAIACFVTGLGVLFKQESTNVSNKRTIWSSYKIILSILSLPQVWTLFLIHMTSMIGFLTNDSVTMLQLVKNNFSDRDIAALATASFPFAVVSGFVVGRALTKSHPLRIWRKLFLYRLGVAVFSQLSVMLIFIYRDHHWRWFIALVPQILTRIMEVTMFVALIAFHASVADPRYGGIYMSLLALTLNIRYDVLQFAYVKTIGLLDGGEDLKHPTRLIDGYQIVNLGGVLLAIPVYWFFIRPATMYLQELEVSKWRIGGIVERDRPESGAVYHEIPLEERFEIDSDDEEEERLDENGGRQQRQS